MKIQKKSFTLTDLENIAHELLPIITQARVIALYGPLGAGKTTLVRAIARSLDIHAPIISPTFTYLARYTSPTGILLYHFDFYRLTSAAYFHEAGFEEYIHDQQALIFIEWPEVIAHLLPAHTCHIHLAYTQKNTNRIIEIRAPKAP